MAKKKDDAEKKDEADAKEAKDAEGSEKKEGEGAEGAEGAAEGAAPAGKSKKKKIIILGAVALVLIIAGGAGAYFAGLFGGGGKHAEEAHDAAPEHRIFYTLPEFLVNLNTTSKQPSYLKATIVLELANQTDVVTVEGNLPVLFDALNTYMRELRGSDLAGSAGLQRLREELMIRCNRVLAPVKVNDVLFKSIVVQ